MEMDYERGTLLTNFGTFSRDCEPIELSLKIRGYQTSFFSIGKHLTSFSPHCTTFMGNRICTGMI